MVRTMGLREKVLWRLDGAADKEEAGRLSKFLLNKLDHFEDPSDGPSTPST